VEIENTDSHIPSTSNTTATLTQNKQQKEPSKARLLPTLQAHPSFGKDCGWLLFRASDLGSREQLTHTARR